MKTLLKFKLLLILLFQFGTIIAQENQVDYSGTWNYEIKNTPTPEYHGKLIFTAKEDGSYVGQIINQDGLEGELEIIRFVGNKLTFGSTIENSNAFFSGFFEDDLFIAKGEVEGEAFVYELEAKKE